MRGSRRENANGPRRRVGEERAGAGGGYVCILSTSFLAGTSTTTTQASPPTTIHDRPDFCQATEAQAKYRDGPRRRRGHAAAGGWVGSRLGLIITFAEIEGEAHNSLDSGGMSARRVQPATGSYSFLGSL
jgi:hypothetical protein